MWATSTDLCATKHPVERVEEEDDEITTITS